MANHYSTEDFALMEKIFRVNFMTSISGYKSLNLCGTQNMEGQTNLSLISSVFHLGSNPPYFGMMFRPLTESGGHTLTNILETGFYSLNHVDEHIYKRAHQTSAKYPKDISEFDACGLNPYYVQNFPAPFVAESKAKLGLKLIEHLPVKLNNTHLIIGELIEVFLENQPDNTGLVDLPSIGTLTVWGNNTYGNVTILEQLPYAKL